VTNLAVCRHKTERGNMNKQACVPSMSLETDLIHECQGVVSTDNGTEIKIHGTHLITFERLALINGSKYSKHSQNRTSSGITTY